MSPYSRRAFLAAAGAALLTGCGGGQADQASDRPSDQPSDRPSDQPSGRQSDALPGDASAGDAVSGRPLARSTPVGLRIPVIGVDTAVMALGLATDGSVEVPPIEAEDRAGWYRHSPTPGQTGPSVILGHVTVGEFGDGVFRRLDRLRGGDLITARLENGTTAEFAVTSVRTVAKADFPTEDVYGNVDRPELRLITCGGPRTGDEYRDNVIVFAALNPGRAGRARRFSARGSGRGSARSAARGLARGSAGDTGER
ncbi:class F sortase [Streptomyces sp. NPDC002328]|uniref:class F sortase n=1 Tax=Streptomyces sp. NPDC002328 TaxID=3364642 RepID=UPI0036B56496